MTNPSSQMINSGAVTSIFGGWPSLHDAEVIRVTLDRDGPDGPELETDIHVFEMTGEVDARGFYELRNHTLVKLRFAGVDQLRLEEFGPQNVLLQLSLGDISDRQLAVLKWDVSFDSSVGVSARFLCTSV
jgi:hypothetical protein